LLNIFFVEYFFLLEMVIFNVACDFLNVFFFFCFVEPTVRSTSLENSRKSPLGTENNERKTSSWTLLFLLLLHLVLLD